MIFDSRLDSWTRSGVADKMMRLKHSNF